MNRQALFFQLLLNRFHPSDKEAVAGSLPQWFKEEINKIQVSWNDPKVLLDPLYTKIRHVHYSWIFPVLEQYPEALRSYIAESLPEPANVRLLALLKAPRTPIATPWGRKYLLNDLAKKLNLDKIVPIEHLPHTLLSFMLEFTKEELIELIDFLGLYDLAEEIRKIVDKNQLKRIYNCLSIKKQHFLRGCLLSKEKVSTPKLELEKWNGEPEALEKLLHKRGLIRLGVALSGQSHDYIWYILHRMDSGRGVLLKKYVSPKEVAGVTPVMVQQVQNVHNFFKKMGPT